MEKDRAQQLLSAAQDVVNDALGTSCNGTVTVDAEIMGTLAGVVQMISDEAWQEIQTITCRISA